jgi:hypothetical protein
MVVKLWPLRAEPLSRTCPLPGPPILRLSRCAGPHHHRGAGPIGPYQIQGAIAAIHGEAPTAADTDGRQIVGLYDVLDQVAPSPAVTLSRAVAVAMVATSL